MLCNLIIFYESRYLKKIKLGNRRFRDWVVLSEITMEFWSLWKDLHPIIRWLILKPMVKAIFSHLFGAHVVKCKTLCRLLILQIFIRFHEPLVLPLLSSLSKKEEGEKKPFPTGILQLRESWTRLEKIRDKVTENLNSDPKFQRSIRMPIQFYLKQFTNYCWNGYLGGKNIVPLFFRWEIEKI